MIKIVIAYAVLIIQYLLILFFCCYFFLLKIYADAFSHEVSDPQDKIDVQKVLKKPIFDINYFFWENLPKIKTIYEPIQ